MQRRTTLKRTGIAVLLINIFSCITPKPAVMIPPPVLYVNIVTHNESNAEYEALYKTRFFEIQDQLKWFGKLCRDSLAVWQMGNDTTMLQAITLYDSDGDASGPLNILKYLHDTLGVIIEAHSTDEMGLSTFEIAGCRIQDELGVIPDNVISGFIYDTTTAVWFGYTTYRPPCADSLTTTWQPRILWGARSVSGAYLNFYGFWKPLSWEHFTTHLSGRRLFNYGSGDMPVLTEGFHAADVLAHFNNTLTLMIDNHVPPEGIYPTSVYFDEKLLLNEGFRNELEILVSGINDFVRAGRMEWKGIDSIYYHWVAGHRADGFTIHSDMTVPVYTH